MVTWKLTSPALLSSSRVALVNHNIKLLVRVARDGDERKWLMVMKKNNEQVHRSTLSFQIAYFIIQIGFYEHHINKPIANSY